MMSHSSMYDFLYFLSTSHFNDLRHTEQTGLSTFRHHSSDSTQEGASLAKTKGVCNVRFVKLPTKPKTLKQC